VNEPREVACVIADTILLPKHLRFVATKARDGNERREIDRRQAATPGRTTSGGRG
jgi:hypothetical protein